MTGHGPPYWPQSQQALDLSRQQETGSRCRAGRGLGRELAPELRACDREEGTVACQAGLCWPGV